jgi:23S rRNA pseudouridine2605 synthase
VRLNKYIALHTGLSRRKSDQLIQGGKVLVNGRAVELGQEVGSQDKVVVDGKPVKASTKIVTIMLNKPVGYVCSRDGQGSKTIYDLLPEEFHNLKPIGRLDKDSSGLLLLTNDGTLANELTHPSRQKEKIYRVELNKILTPEDKIKIERGVKLEDGPSKLQLSGAGQKWQVTMREGRNRQIRRTFAALGYKATKLHRTKFGQYNLDNLQTGKLSVLAQ